MDTFNIQKQNCPNCWGHQQYDKQSKSSTDLNKDWMSKCVHTIGWIQRHVRQYLLPK